TSATRRVPKSGTGVRAGLRARPAAGSQTKAGVTFDCPSPRARSRTSKSTSGVKSVGGYGPAYSSE
ncbi:MAG: hypothetical protein M3362_11150, partial [Acidobacteriota bacterium]|nr:hypothetical protein [Acidobacteriota bacterium]